MLCVCFSSEWPLSGALRQGARMRLFEPGRPSERPPLLPSVNNPNLPYLPTPVPFMRLGEREIRESRPHLDSPVLKAECPICPCSSCSWAGLWLRGNSPAPRQSGEGGPGSLRCYPSPILQAKGAFSPLLLAWIGCQDGWSPL